VYCKYPNCRKAACKTYAMVDLCEAHHEKIETETHRFYERGMRNGLQADEITSRRYYYRIAPLIKWSKYNMHHVYKDSGRLRGRAYTTKTIPTH